MRTTTWCEMYRGKLLGQRDYEWQLALQPCELLITNSNLWLSACIIYSHAMQSTSHANADAGINTQAGSSAIDRGNGRGWRDRKRHAEFVSRRDDLSSEGNVSRRCANADAETHVLHMSLQESETAAAAVASKWVSHLEGKARREFVRSQRERQTRQRERCVWVRRRTGMRSK